MRKYQRGFWQFAIPAAAAVIGGALSANSQSKAASAAARAQEEANERNIAAQKEMNEANLAAQKEFAQHGIAWKVQDAKEAGLHPLFGAGLTGSSFSPSFQAADVRPVPTRPAQDFSWLAQVGQLMGNFLGDRQAATRTQMANAAATQGIGEQSVSIVEHPGGGRTITYPIRGLESQVSGVSVDAPMALTSPSSSTDLRDPKSHISNAYSAHLPFWQQYQMAPGFRMILPKTSEPQEVFEDKPAWFWVAVAKANVAEYGPEWLVRAKQMFPSLMQVENVVDAALSAVMPDIFKRANEAGRRFGRETREAFEFYRRGQQFNR